MDRDTYREVRRFLVEANNALNLAIVRLESAGAGIARGAGGREVALSKTEVQTARHWHYDAIEAVDKEAQ